MKSTWGGMNSVLRSYKAQLGISQYFEKDELRDQIVYGLNLFSASTSHSGTQSTLR